MQRKNDMYIMCHPQNFPCTTLMKTTTSVWNYTQLITCTKAQSKLSTYVILEGEFNLNKTPLTPLGSKYLVYEDTKLQNFIFPTYKNTWYIGPAIQHYCC